MRCIALLRGINVGGNKRIRMADLCATLAGIGLGNPRALLQSGNVVFETRAARAATIERRIHDAVRAELGIESEIFVRTAAEWQATVKANPFPEIADSEPGKLLVMSLRSKPSAAQVAALRAAIRGPEQVEVVDREAFLAYPDGIGRSKLTNVVVEKHLGSPGTARNWNTVRKLLALVES